MLNINKKKLFKLEFQLMEPIPPETLADPTSVNSHGARVVIFNPLDKAILYKLALTNQLGKLSFFSEESFLNIKKTLNKFGFFDEK